MSLTSAWRQHEETAAGLRRVWRSRLRIPTRHPPDLPRDWYATLKSQGIVVVPDFYTREQCAEATSELRRLEQTYPSCVHRRSDRRLFGVNRASPKLRQFAEHPALVAMARAFYAVDRVSCLTLGAQLPFIEGNRGSGEGWHRDALVPQFKSILYLTDVSLENGPFEIIPESHRLRNLTRDIVLHGLGSRVRLEDAEVQSIQARRYPGGVLTVTGLAGTLVLIHASAVHRGRPIAKGERAALTNYYFGSAAVPPRQEQHFSPVLPFVS
jgi:phytanoyl-CoA dioxygenase PhyH